MSSPHEAIAGRYESKLDKPEYVHSLFERGAPHYETIGKVGFFGTGHVYRRAALKRAGLEPGMKVIDVACGTGAVTRAAIELVGESGSVLGVDPNAGMMAEARKLSDIEFKEGNAENLPAEDEVFDFLSMGYALRHVDNLLETFREYHRVLMPGGRISILEITRPKSKAGLAFSKFYFRDLVPAVSKLVTGSEDAREMMVYYWETIDACVPPADILEAINAAGFKEVKRRVQLGIFSEYQAVK